MKSAIKGSISAEVAEYVEQLPEDSFVTAGDFKHPRDPVNTALSRLLAEGKLRRVRKGLYWKGTETWLGMSPPSTEEVAIRVGGPGSGPADVSAAHWLRLTTQVPTRFWTAVPSRAPKGWRWVRFTERSSGRRLRGLRPDEVAVMEVLRSGPWVIEVEWSRLEKLVSDLLERGDFRAHLVDEQIREEHHVAARERWSEMVETIPALSGALAT